MEYSGLHRDLSQVGIMAFPGAFQKEFDPLVFIKLGEDLNLVASYPLRTCLGVQCQPESAIGLLCLADRDRHVSGFG